MGLFSKSCWFSTLSPVFDDCAGGVIPLISPVAGNIEMLSCGLLNPIIELVLPGFGIVGGIVIAGLVSLVNTFGLVSSGLLETW